MDGGPDGQSKTTSKTKSKKKKMKKGSAGYAGKTEHRKRKDKKKFSTESQGFGHLYFSLHVSEEQRVRFA
jgi:hypothetical protein